MSKANIQRSEHTLNGMAARSCHSIHHSSTPKFLLAKKQNETCYGCHANIRAQFGDAFASPRERRFHGMFRLPQSARREFAALSGSGLHPTMVERAFDTDPPCLKCPRR